MAANVDWSLSTLTMTAFGGIAARENLVANKYNAGPHGTGRWGKNLSDAHLSPQVYGVVVSHALECRKRRTADILRTFRLNYRMGKLPRTYEK
jgi:hypothetical protein